MAITETQFYAKARGSLREDEDWWYLCVDAESGNKTVRHEWSYTNAYGPGQNSGTTTVPVDEFLASDADKAAKDKLQAMLDAGT